MLSDWPARADVAARRILLAGCNEVLDIGAGNATLANTLNFYGYRGIYKPVDLHKRDERFGIIDLESEVLPELKYSMHVYVGVLEYLNNLDRVLCWSFKNSSYLLICYVPMNKNGFIRENLARLHRWALRWESDCEENEIINKVRKAGFEIKIAEKDEFGLWITARIPG
jgi:hypothetical protein